jgi:hypothetical protein
MPASLYVIFTHSPAFRDFANRIGLFFGWLLGDGALGLFAGLEEWA